MMACLEATTPAALMASGEAVAASPEHAPYREGRVASAAVIDLWQVIDLSHVIDLLRIGCCMCKGALHGARTLRALKSSKQIISSTPGNVRPRRTFAPCAAGWMRIILCDAHRSCEACHLDMEKCMNIVKVLVAGAAVVMLAASPAFAQRQGIGDKAPQVGARVHSEGVGARAQAVPRTGRHAQSALRARAQVNSFGDHMDAARDKAMRECMGSSRRYSQTTWGNMEIHVQRSCMAAHGQME
jgi:hypothetical protein